jgi:hypothetical protein
MYVCSSLNGIQNYAIGTLQAPISLVSSLSKGKINTYKPYGIKKNKRVTSCDCDIVIVVL